MRSDFGRLSLLSLRLIRDDRKSEIFVCISFQDFSTSPSSSALMIVDNDIPSENSHSNPNANPLLSLSNEYFTDSSSPIYRSHIQKRHINLGRYYDGMMRAKTSQLPTHDLRCNLALIEPYKSLSSEGVTEETVRKGRILLDQMPDSVELKNQIDERPIRSILKQTRFSSPEQFSTSHSEDQSLIIEDKEKTPSRRIVTTITEEFHRIHRQIIEDIETGIDISFCFFSSVTYTSPSIYDRISSIK